MRITKKKYRICLVLGLVLVLGLAGQATAYNQSLVTKVKLSTAHRLEKSNTAGNLITNALQEETRAQIALFPSYSGLNQYAESIGAGQRVNYEQIFALYNYIATNRAVLIKIKGRELKKFINQRLKRYDNADLQVAGLHYTLKTKADEVVDISYKLSSGKQIKPNKSYLVVCDSYQYQNNYRLEDKVITAWYSEQTEQEILSDYLDSKPILSQALTAKRIVIKPKEERKNPGGDTKQPPLEEYYQPAANKTGQQLKQSLNQIIDQHQVYKYSITEKYLKKTDQAPQNTDNVILFYTGRSQPKNTFGGYSNDWNREHVWPKSHGFSQEGQIAYSDLHNLRPTDASVNSTRGNKDFANGGRRPAEATECKTDRDSWEPRDEVKGDVARIVFYMAVRYEGDNNNPDLELVNQLPTNGPHLGKLSTLLKWHHQDPVDKRERRRNNLIYKYQGNRNPFIDHPEWVTEIWGSN